MQEATQSMHFLGPSTRGRHPFLPRERVNSDCGRKYSRASLPTDFLPEENPPQGRGQGSPLRSAQHSVAEGSCMASALANFQLGVCGFTLLPRSHVHTFPPPCLPRLSPSLFLSLLPPTPRPCGMLTAGKDRQYFYHDLRAASAVVSQEGAAGM